MFEGLQIALTGVRAGQVGLDTAANNIANANAPGYTRQRVNLTSLAPWNSVGGPIGMGVDINGITRLREGFLDSRARVTGAASAHAQARADLLTQTEALLGEPDAGIQQAMLGVFDAFDDLALDPSNMALRDNTIAAFDALGGRIRSVATTWSQLAEDAQTQLDSALVEANQLLARVDSLNRDISAAGANPSNTALDARDLLLDELSSSLGVTIEVRGNGMVDVVLDGQRLVDSATSTVRTLSRDATLGVVVNGTTPVTPGGEVGGLNTFVTTDLPALRGDLDQLAFDIRDAVNAVNASGSAPDAGGVTWTDGGPALLAATSAADFGVAAGITGEDLATAALGNHALHDATNVLRFAALRDGNPPGLGAPPLDERLRTLVVGLGNTTMDATARATTEQALHANATAARQSGHGVNLDEEMISLVQHQRALEAASRAMSAIDEALDILINRTGVVGR
ncbi:MAG TPA: flagellar hook-associated protein FlgK [Euzebyales bacterium]|nr:flagellar hook-associated protein FlgK [Euzebyales bacterium]